MSNVIIQCPKCGSQARNNMGSTATALCWIPNSYDKDGNVTYHPNPNIYTVCWECVDCGCRYTSKSIKGELIVEEGYL